MKKYCLLGFYLALEEKKLKKRKFRHIFHSLDIIVIRCLCCLYSFKFLSYIKKKRMNIFCAQDITKCSCFFACRHYLLVFRLLSWFVVFGWFHLRQKHKTIRFCLHSILTLTFFLALCCKKQWISLFCLVDTICLTSSFWLIFDLIFRWSSQATFSMIRVLSSHQRKLSLRD